MVMAVSAAEMRRERHGGQFGLRRPAVMGSRRGAGRLLLLALLAAGTLWNVSGSGVGIAFLCSLAVLSLLCAVMRICHGPGEGGWGVCCAVQGRC